MRYSTGWWKKTGNAMKRTFCSEESATSRVKQRHGETLEMVVLGCYVGNPPYWYWSVRNNGSLGPSES